MTTLKGLFDPQPRSQRNFLLENKRDIKAKSASNSQKPRGASDLPQKQRLSLNSAPAKSHSGPVFESAGSRQRLKMKDVPSLRLVHQPSQPSKDDSSRKIHPLNHSAKSKNPSSTRQLTSSSRTMNYIHQENVPFEWTEVCPSLISHNICHQGVQTEDKNPETLTKDARISAIFTNNEECEEREVQSPKMSATKPIEDENAPFPCYYNHNSSSDYPAIKENFIGERTGTKVNMGLEIHPEDDNYQLKEHAACSSERPMVYKGLSNVQSVNKEHTQHSSHKSSHLVSDLENLRMSSSRKLTAENPTLCPSSYQRGVVPRYLTKRKTEQALASARAKEIDPNCPLGHAVMPDNERRETLDMILKNYNDLISELNKIPVRTDTLKMKQRKIEIEKQLDKLEEGIRIFSRSKVYVQLDA